MKTLKCEQVYVSEYDNLADAKAQIGHFLEAVYNQKRLYSSLGYLPLAEYETQFKKAYAQNRDKNQTITPQLFVSSEGFSPGTLPAQTSRVRILRRILMNSFHIKR